MDLVKHVEEALGKVYKNMPEDFQPVLDIEGLSSPNIRRFINAVCNKPIDNYLEVGTWLGSTLISAAYKNEHLLSCGIDDFSQFFNGVPQDQTRNRLLENLKTVKAPRFECRLIEGNCWDMRKMYQSLSTYPPVTAYLYDGAHDALSQYRGITHFNRYLAEDCIVMVDDWDTSKEVASGTFSAFSDLGYRIVKDWALPRALGWHEGFYIAVVKKHNATTN